MAFTEDGSDPDNLIECECCPEKHDHGAAARSCPQDHDGPCALETDGCTVCRPLTITAMPGSVALRGVA